MICGPGLNSLICLLGLCSVSKTGSSSSEVTWGTRLCSSSKTRELVGAAGLKVPAAGGVCGDAQLRVYALR